jgi:hypothetical protein
VHALGGDQKAGAVLELPIRGERHPEGIEIVGNVRVAHVPAHSPKNLRAEKSFSNFRLWFVEEAAFCNAAKA